MLRWFLVVTYLFGRPLHEHRHGASMQADIAAGYPNRSARSCNSDGLFLLLASMKLKAPLDLHIRFRKPAEKDEVRLGPRVTSDNVRLSIWYGLLLILLS